MKIRVLRSLGRGLPSYSEGQEVDVKDSEGKHLIELGLAEEIKIVGVHATPAIQAVPPAAPVQSEAPKPSPPKPAAPKAESPVKRHSQTPKAK